MYFTRSSALRRLAYVYGGGWAVVRSEAVSTFAGYATVVGYVVWVPFVGYRRRYLR